MMNEKAYVKKVMKPNFKLGIVFSESLMGCKIEKTSVVMDKPVYLGQAIIDLSKIIMYEFLYDHVSMVRNFGCSSHLWQGSKHKTG